MKEIDEEMNGFKDMRIVDNFYQTSSFFPMPTTEIGTLNEEGKTNLGSYSLCFPYYIAEKTIMLCYFAVEIALIHVKYIKNWKMFN